MSSSKNVTRRAALAVGAIGLVGSSALAADKKKKYERVHKAIEEMTESKEYLEKAADVFGDHKKKAIELLSDAIKECRAALKYANDL